MNLRHTRSTLYMYTISCRQVHIFSMLKEICLWQHSSTKCWNHLNSCISYGDHHHHHIIRKIHNILPFLRTRDKDLKLMKGLPGKVYFLEALRTHVFILYYIPNLYMQAMQHRKPTKKCSNSSYHA